MTSLLSLKVNTNVFINLVNARYITLTNYLHRFCTINEQIRVPDPVLYFNKVSGVRLVVKSQGN